ncbi:hypothetical protein RD792_016806, partial [Penstemon davidsonii]
MYLVESNSGGAIACMLLELVFLGTWPAILAHLERRGTYLDYSLANLLTAVVIALTVGQIGDAKFGLRNFIPQLSQLQKNWPSIMFAMAGGVFLSLENLSQQYAWALVGLSVTEVITSSIAIVLGQCCYQIMDNQFRIYLDVYNEEDKTSVGSAEYLVEVENNRAIKVFGKTIWLGLSVTFFGGVCYSLFSPAFNLATTINST